MLGDDVIEIKYYLELPVHAAHIYPYLATIIQCEVYGY